jgi:hypothetical protein
MRRFALAILCLPLLAVSAAAYEPGTAGLLFLRLGVGERAAGMGDAYTALAADATALYWNPAGLAAMQGSQLHLMHNEWMQSVRQEFVGLAHHLPERAGLLPAGTYGIGLTNLNMDEMELREDSPASEPLGHFSAFDFALQMGYGRSVGAVDAGFSVKWIYSRLYESNAKGFLLDLGLRHVTRIPGLVVGAAFQHLGPAFKYDVEEFDAPRTLKLGAGYTLPVVFGGSDLSLAYDLLLLSDSDTGGGDPLGESKALSGRHHFGLELDYQGLAALRAGYKAGYDSQGASFGAGLRWRSFVFDYAFLAVSNDLGNAHRFGVTLDL